jgi:hypothetical protein
MKKRVIDLVSGDVLSGTKMKVVKGPYDSVRCPKGKTNLVVEYPNGEQYSKVWGKYTTVDVEEKESETV